MYLAGGLHFNRLDDLKKHALDQVEKLRAVATQLEQPGNHEWDFSLVARFNYARVAAMDDAKLFNALVLRDGVDEEACRDAYLEVTGDVDYLSKISSHMVKIHEQLSADYRTFEESWYHGLGMLKNRIVAWQSARLSNSEFSRDPLLEDLFSCFVSTFSHKDTVPGMAVVMESFIKPLIHALDTYPADPRCPEISLVADDCNHASLNLEKVKSEACSSFRGCADRIDKTIVKLHSSLVSLKNGSHIELSA